MPQSPRPRRVAPGPKWFDPERYVPDKSDRFGFYLLGRWSSVELIMVLLDNEAGAANAAAGGDGGACSDLAAHIPAEYFAALRDVPLMFQYRSDAAAESELWLLQPILDNWVTRLNLRASAPARRGSGKAKTAKKARMRRLVHNIREWTDSTRGLADDVRTLVGDGLPELMRRAADEADRVLHWPAQRIKNPPHDGQGLADLLLNIDLWAFDQFVDALNEVSRPRFQKHAMMTLGANGADAVLGPAIDALRSRSLPTPGSEVWKMRIARLDHRIKPGQGDNLMADVLFSLRETYVK